MIPLHASRRVGAAVAAAVLAVPAAALAHPSVYQTSAPVSCTAPGPAGTYTAAQFLATCANQTRYVFTNHGNTYLLRESNGKTTGGAISYAHRPGGPAVPVTVPPTPPNPGLRDASDFNIFASFPQGPTTGGQPHATCDAPALSTATVIRSWQDADPFYAYVPFQRDPVGVDDEGSAATWRTAVQTATGVNLGTLADTDAAREAACEALPGATASSYHPADATQNTLASWSSGQVHIATAPLEQEIGEQRARIGALGVVGGTTSQQVRALEAQIDKLHLELRTLKLSLPSSIPTPGAFATTGLALTLAGPPSRTVSVRALISAAQARKLGLRSRIVAGESVQLDVGGSGSATLTATNAAVAGLTRAKGPLVVAVEAKTGDRYSSASAALGG